MEYLKELVEKRNELLEWINSQHEAITITSFVWEGCKMELLDAGKVKVDFGGTGEATYQSWESAFDGVITYLVS